MDSLAEPAEPDGGKDESPSSTVLASQFSQLLRWIPLEPAPAELAAYGAALGLDDRASALRALARAVAASPSLGGSPTAALALRLEPRPHLALVGTFEDADVDILDLQVQSLRHGCGTLRFVTYSQAEEDCRRLADLLLERYGGELDHLRFVAIPRGGLVVLGLLAKILDLAAEQLELPSDDGQPLVVVDDCALSGECFARWLGGHGGQRVTFAHLYSDPALRRAVEGDERVLACIAARDLRAHDGPSPEKANLRTDLWQERLGSFRYRAACLDHLCFPWTEPRRTLWNSVRERAEAAWTLVPEEFRLRSRRPSFLPLPVYEAAPPAIGDLQPADGVLYAPLAGGLALANFEDGESCFLRGSAPQMWQAVVSTGDVGKALETLQEAYDNAPPRLATDLESFVESLLERGLLLGGS